MISSQNGTEPQTVRQASAAEIRVLEHLQTRAQQAAEDFREALYAFAPDGCELRAGKWVRPAEVAADE